MRSSFASVAAAAVAVSQVVGAVDLNTNDASSIKSAASAVAKNLWGYYTGDKDASQVGLLPKPYYWWEAGAMFGTMLDYSYLTGDHQYDSDIAAAIFSQASPTKDFMMLSTQSGDLGNDDQGFWALTAMTAAEHKLAPPQGQPDDIWLTLASGAFNDLIGRWNTSFCGGGIKWQFIQANNGYKYKSSIANGATMQLGARLALLTGNQTYADKAAMIYDWMTAVGFISSDFQVFDGAGDDPDNCTKIDRHEWSYNSGALIGGAAAMANYTASKGGPDANQWAQRVSGLWNHASQNFFQNGVLYEQACEGVNTCDVDQWSFKAYLARWATFAGQVVPAMMPSVQGRLQTSAAAAAKSCTGNSANACGTQWWNNNYNNNAGVGQEMSALETIIGLLAPQVPFVPGISSGSSSQPASSSSSAAPATFSTAPQQSTSSAAPAASPTASTMATSVSSSASGAASPASSSSAPAAAAAASSGAPATDNKQGGNFQVNNAPRVMINDQGIPYCTQAAY